MSVSKAEDEGKLAELGYTQELRRDWGLLHNFGASFSIIVCVGIIVSAAALTKRHRVPSPVKQRMHFAPAPQLLATTDWSQALQLWPQHRWSRFHDNRLDYCQLLQYSLTRFHNDSLLTEASIPRRDQHGRDRFCHSNIRWTVLLGIYARTSRTRPFLRMDHWMVSLIGVPAGSAR